jgi:hypothetical protein
MTRAWWTSKLFTNNWPLRDLSATGDFEKRGEMKRGDMVSLDTRTSEGQL